MPELIASNHALGWTRRIKRKCNKRPRIFVLHEGHHRVIYLRVIYFLPRLVSNTVMHVAAIFVRSALNIIDGLFVIGVIGSTAVLFLSFIEDIKTILS